MSSDKYLEKWCYNNWMKIDQKDRQSCLELLRGWLPKDYIEGMKTNLANGLGLSDGNPYFHFGEGMQIRNQLRSVIPDDGLPGVLYDTKSGANKFVAKNWDDYYIGALIELCETTP